MLNHYDVGIYARLSRDDNCGNQESMSIGNQKQILTDYVTERGWNLTDVYVDDGFSGTNFDRPDFKRLKRDIESGIINCVITKDLSRLGRNYSMTGYYTDEYFPERQVRYIAINDGVDTMGKDNDFAAFHNVINEYYPKDISRKVRQVKKTNAAKGMFMGSHAPYGYKKSPMDKHQLIIDEDVKPVVKRIFTEIANGNNGRRLAEQLNADGIPCPRAYYYQTIDRENPNKSENMLWGSATVLSMIDNQAYIGHLIQGRREVISFKTKKRRVTRPDEWIVVENTHEPIISQELWDEAHKARKNGERYHTTKKREVSIFAGLVRCADCGSTMSASMRGIKGSEKLTYRCGKYTNYGKEACPSHNIREEVLETIVLDDIHAYAKIAEQDKQGLIDRVLTALKDKLKTESDTASKQLAASERKVEEINTTVKNLYKEKVSGKMPETFFYNLLADYEKELQTIEEKLPTLREKAKAERGQDEKVRRFVDNISKYLEIEHIDRYMARELIESVTVSQFYKVNGKNTQDVTINYKFVGDLAKLLEDGDGKGAA